MILTLKFPVFKKLSCVLLFVLVITPFSLFFGCSGDDDEPSTEGIEEIAGTWMATSASFNGVDVIAEGGSVKLVSVS